MEKTNYIKNAHSKNTLIEQYANLVFFVAKRMMKKLPPSISIDELISAGNLGLIDAVNKFDESKNISLQTYAQYRIQGAILDELRNMDWYSRSIRKKVQDIEKAIAKIEQKTNRPAESNEIAKELGIDIEEYYNALTEINSATVIDLDSFIYNSKKEVETNTTLKDNITDNKESPETSYVNEEMKKGLIKAIKTLSENEQMVISLYYFDELTLKEIGQVLELTESRVCQIHTVAILKLKTRMQVFYKN